MGCVPVQGIRPRSRSGRTRRLCENRSDRFGAGFGQGDGARADHVLFLMVDAECLVNSGEQRGGTGLAIDDGPAGCVGLAVDGTAADSTAGERGAPGGGEVGLGPGSG